MGKQRCCQVKALLDLPLRHRRISWIPWWSPTQAQAKEGLCRIHFGSQRNLNQALKIHLPWNMLAKYKKKKNSLNLQTKDLGSGSVERRNKTKGLHLPVGERSKSVRTEWLSDTSFSHGWSPFVLEQKGSPKEREPNMENSSS